MVGIRIYDSDNIGQPVQGTIINGDLYQVQTAAGSTVKLFEAYAMAQQPQATQQNPNNVDITYNCHGYTWGAVNVQGHSFSIVQDADAKALIRDTLTQLTVAQALQELPSNLVYVLYDTNGNAIHSARGARMYGTSDGKLSPSNDGVNTKNEWQALNTSGTLADAMKVFKQYKDVKIYKWN
jgi:hypothetical protein